VTVRTLATALAIADRIDWARADTVTAAREGLARDVTAAR
jgi:hypothetical protein